ncbi:hypothetical protein HGM15179_021517 [Zosterops borbonicus]|uniref:Uncharacterized protein n=1 Tax=Zosterops borbonicus TaxID=364589 RepID=A0A8K1FX08_9PASS|nr:hypothetical protein HGM15179_021517 [Zosterops borbonicus]
MASDQHLDWPQTSTWNGLGPAPGMASDQLGPAPGMASDQLGPAPGMVSDQHLEWPQTSLDQHLEWPRTSTTPTVPVGAPDGNQTHSDLSHGEPCGDGNSEPDLGAEPGSDSSSWCSTWIPP